MQLNLIELEVPVKSYLHFKISAMPARVAVAVPRNAGVACFYIFNTTLLKFSLDIPEDIFRVGRQLLYFFRAVRFIKIYFS